MRKTVTQIINAPVHGHVVAGNLTVNHHHELGLAVGQIVMNVTRRRSYRERIHAELAESCHWQIDLLLKVMSPNELLWSVSKRALGVCDRGQLIQINKWLDYLYAAVSLPLLLGVLLMGLEAFYSPVLLHAPWWQKSAVAGVFSLDLMLIFWVLQNHVRPQMTAQKALKQLKRLRRET